MKVPQSLIYANRRKSQEFWKSLVRKFETGVVAIAHSRKRDVLILSDVYPQPSASAAGVRTSYLIRGLSQDEYWGNVHYAASALTCDTDERFELARDHGVKFHSIQPNRSKMMKDLLDSIGKENLSLVIFDRFYVEEKFSFQIRQHCPNAVRVVDTQDLHSLRRGRQKVVEVHDKSVDNKADPLACVVPSLGHRPSSQDGLLLRELASLHRSDLSLICSPFEYDLLGNVYGIPESKLCKASFWVDNVHGSLSWGERSDFCVLGGFRHPPNVDSVIQLAHCIWPRIRQKLPNANLHVYGAFVPPNIHALHDPSIGFLVHGYVPTLHEALHDKRVLLAPLRFGAGIKGKIVDAWTFGLPVITTSIGSEGMGDEQCRGKWGGMIADDTNEFVKRAVELYTNQGMWESCVKRGRSILHDLYREEHWDKVATALRNAVGQRDLNRSNDYVGSMLWEQSTRSTEYFSRWIECKESKTHRDDD